MSISDLLEALITATVYLFIYFLSLVAFSLSSCPPNLGNVYTAGYSALSLLPLPLVLYNWLLLPRSLICYFVQLNLPNSLFLGFTDEAFPAETSWYLWWTCKCISQDAINEQLIWKYGCDVDMSVWINRLQTAWQWSRRGGYMISPMYWKGWG